MLGSMTVYRRLLHETVFTEHNLRVLLPPAIRPSNANIKQYSKQLPALGHAIAGMMAGWTVSLVATPVEHIKARLQVQYAADKSKRLYSGPIDCGTKIVRTSKAQTYHPQHNMSQDQSNADPLSSSTPTVSAASTTGSFQRCSSAPFSSSGGPLSYPCKSLALLPHPRNTR